MIFIIDLGSQYTMLIARRIRELGVRSEIGPPQISIAALKDCDGVVLSGGPSSAYEKKVVIDKKILNSEKPVLGICLGMQMIAHLLGGKVTRGKREYGKTKVSLEQESPLFQGLPTEIISWMSHGDRVSLSPDGFSTIAHSDEIEIAAFQGSINSQKPNIFGFQFHPEVVHTEMGDKILRNFVFNICKAKTDWTPKYFIDEKVKEIKLTVEDKKVIVGLSGGIDSAVTCKLVSQAIEDNCIPIFVDTGLLRLGEPEEIKKNFKNVYSVDAENEFFSALTGITDPEEKRKIMGRKFVEIFEQEAKKFDKVEFLAQGTLYPDRIESQSQVGPSATIKTHHNVGGLPEQMGLKLIEPLRDLFKDEVRKIGNLLGLSEDIVGKHPFPGPGLAIRIIGEITRERAAILKKADSIYIEEIRRADLYDKIWQAFALLLPVRSVGVMGDKRSYEDVIALRAVTSVDGMTAAPFKFPWNNLMRAGDRIVREVSGINRVVYDITSKPPATIEWE